MICANKCSSSSGYHFAYLKVTQLNQVEYLSVSSCSHSSSGRYPIGLQTCNHSVDHTNCSMNNANQVSGIRIISPYSFTSSFSTFSNNKVYESICIYIYSPSGTISMSYANIVHNNSPSLAVVHFEGTGSRKMMYCIFQNNQDILFCVYEGSLEVSHSFISHSGSFSASTAVSTSSNNSFTYMITYQILFFNSLHCNADMPVKERTPIQTFEKSAMRSLEETISRTKEETLRMTFERTIDQTMRESPKETIPRTYVDIVCSHQMVNKREISVIFSFSFLYPIVILMIS